ncbi:tRNA (adenosine(37)-N6)-threonylcarbamoyltransferase complex ATPase subunit type 1 TsaE [Paradevosia shaoguanensis]|uniref:tRNA (adenosine(37)-N6)-threonylcarbamoyltransferase complex ATPase subunit type 1 TsaE n=1 Tax=Paradevosia shaoguanensis TaxID=1335043 RepID=UPI000455C6C1|nr:tRNA (adenosine(37)-N6)-threonylcarbamoyltransferase complex ATPase subunit type 1 TsaE [Paradevosia shaoguanensis]CDP51335.1 ATPase YjeE, predicted to have essential role in c ell wall biosynthesis [Devosia sp. DBB001]
MPFLADDAATARLGAALADALRPGELVVLEGDLGAGKTALARAIIRTLMGDERMDVPSPSFALVQPYEGQGISVLHADLYRLADASEVGELGLFDNPRAIVLVEWAERAPDLEAEAGLRVTLSVPQGGQGRQAEIVFRDGRPFSFG